MTANSYVDAVVGADVFVDRHSAFPAKRIVVCDDSGAVRKTVARMLGSMGCEAVFEAETAADSYRLIHEEKAHVLICDVEMPGTGGLTLLRAIRKTPALSRLAVIMMSPSRVSQHVASARDALADVYMLKPFTADHLHGKIREAVANACRTERR